MIYTVTVTPSLDYVVDVEHFRSGKVNRTLTEKVLPGGKGINVSIVLHNLGIETVALGFTAGFTGDKIRKMLDEKGLVTDFLDIPGGMSRINVKLRSDQESEINGRGPLVPESSVKALYARLDKLVGGDILVLAGSVPAGLSESFYMDILEYLQNRKIRFVVDATKDLLKNVLPYHPFLVKPNSHELGDLFDVKIASKSDVITYGKRLKEMGAHNVLVSMAGDGAVLISEDGAVYAGKAPEGHLVNSVGAGDSMVAGFLAGFLVTGKYSEALKEGLCAGTASACSEELSTKEQVDFLLKNTKFNF